MQASGMGAMVVSSNQNGSYASQYGLQPPMQAQGYPGGLPYGQQQAQYGGVGMAMYTSGPSQQGIYGQQSQMPGAQYQPTMQPPAQAQPMSYGQQAPSVPQQSQQQFGLPMQQSHGQPHQNLQQQQAPYPPYTTQAQYGQNMMGQPPAQQQGFY
jgi:hypothetical protein